MKQLILTLKIFITPYVILFSFAAMISLIAFIIKMDSSVFNHTIELLNPIIHTPYRVFFFFMDFR